MGVKKICAVFLTLSLLFTACADGTTTSIENAEQGNAENIKEMETQEPLIEKVWVANKSEIPNPDAALPDIVTEDMKVFVGDCRLVNGTVYRILTFALSNGVDSLQYTNMCIQVLKEPYAAWENYVIGFDEWGLGDSCRPWGYTWSTYVSEQGNVYVLLCDSEQDYIGKWSVETGCSVQEIHSDWLSEHTFWDGTYPYGWSANENHGYYFIYDNMAKGDSSFAYKFFDCDFREKKGIPEITDGMVWQIENPSFSDELYMYGCDSEQVTITPEKISVPDSGFTIWKFGQKEPLFQTKEVGMCWNDIVMMSSETEGYLFNVSGIWGFSIEAQSVYPIFECALEPELFADMVFKYGACLQEDEGFQLLTANYENEYFMWEIKEDEKDNTEKQQIEIAVTLEDRFLKQVIADYNKQSEQYEICLRKAEDGENLDDFRARIQAELAAGNGPDLLAANTVVDLSSAAKKQYIMELTKEFDSYSEEVLPSVWKTGMVNDKLYAVPYSCGINTLISSNALVEKRGGWTAEEAMQCMEESGLRHFQGLADEAYVFYSMGLATESNAQIVDWKNGKSKFGSVEALSLLRFAEKYADKESDYVNVYQRTADGEILTHLLYLNNYSSIQIGEAMFDGDVNYIGFPVEDGGSGHLVYGNSFAISRTCEDVEGAIDFLKFLLSRDVQMQIAEQSYQNRMTGFPVSTDALETLFEYMRSEKDGEPRISSIGEFNYEETALSEKQIANLRNVFYQARPMGKNAEILYDFVSEELGIYLSGEKDAEAVLEVLQNRVQLFMDENSY